MEKLLFVQNGYFVSDKYISLGWLIVILYNIHRLLARKRVEVV